MSDETISNGFLLQTASDYDMPIHEVERIYNSTDGIEFYMELEKFINQRADK